jgi:hypothetical protein
MNAVNLHLLIAEGCYTDGANVASQIKRRITNIAGQVDFLLHAIPATGGENEFLKEWREVKFQHTKYYDPHDQSFHEKTGIPLNTLKFKVKSASLERVKRNIQREDGLLYHKLVRDEAGKVVEILPGWEIPHDCIRASGQVQLRHNLEYVESQRLWAKDVI